MAYALSERFSLPSQYYRILDPGAYQNISNPLTYAHKVPFLSNTPRRTQAGNKLWTHAIYNSDLPKRILNCTALKSKLPRFPYEAMTKEDFEKILCQCGIQSTCECSTSEVEEEEETIVCQGKVRRRIFKGPPPRESMPSELRAIKIKTEPPFYDARVIESTSFYKGCKWSQWSSKRSNDIVISGPGPAHYSLERDPCYETVCAEKVRAHKRKTSKQLRFIEMVQQQNMRENLPGPGSYNPQEPKGTNLSYLGPKAQRFLTCQYDIRPGPSDHQVKRDFDPAEEPDKFCYAKLPAPAPFGSKAVRLRPKREEGPSPASYDSKPSACKVMRCTKAPFGISSVRFKEVIDESSYEDNNIDEEKPESDKEPGDKQNCLLPTWEFRSQTVRMKSLLKKFNEPSPADLPQAKVQISRSNQLQSTAPFFTSDERFRPWYNWIPVHASENTPGPCYYCLEKPKCFPAVRRGPLTRSLRFKPVISQTPSPNEYRVYGGIENILTTHNERLKRNIDNQHKFCWKARKEIKNLNLEEKEKLLLNQSIALLDVNLMENIGNGLSES